MLTHDTRHTTHHTKYLYKGVQFNIVRDIVEIKLSTENGMMTVTVTAILLIKYNLEVKERAKRD